MVFLAAFCLFALAGAAAKATPVQKVTQLHNGMAAKAKQEKHEEQVQFAVCEQFCYNTTIEPSLTR